MQQADNLCNSVGILQQTSQPSPLAGGKSAHHALDTDHTQLFAQMIARTGKDIEVRGVDYNGGLRLFHNHPSKECTKTNHV